MSEQEVVGKVTHRFTELGCVAIKLQKGSIKLGDELLFVKGELPEKDGKDKESSNDPARYRRPHIVQSIQINHQDRASVEAGEECAVMIAAPGRDLPPNNASVFLLNQLQRSGSVGSCEASPYFSSGPKYVPQSGGTFFNILFMLYLNYENDNKSPSRIFGKIEKKEIS